MSFATWMHELGLSDSTVSKYNGAIEGVLTDWAQDAGIIKGSILNITSAAHFNLVAQKIQLLPIFLERNHTGHNMYSSAIKRYDEFLRQSTIAGIEKDIDSIVLNPNVDATEKVRLISSRIGQGLFRKSVVNYWKGCSVTGYPDTSLLVASHIKPWVVSSNHERLDKFNGLLLMPNLDKLFDKGLITFDPKGKLVVSQVLVNPNVFGLSSNMSVELVTEHQAYMKYHRNNIFVDT